MKIPESQPNGACFGNEENEQWQGNGVILDNGAGGGDAHRPVYPVHIPRGHVPGGYVMAGPYYPGAYPAPQDDFADYMWMENEEEFDKQVMQQLEEEALMEQCIEAMLEDEQRERQRPANGDSATTSNGSTLLSLEEAVSKSTLNPLAAEFIPNRARRTTEESQPAQPVTEAHTEVESPKQESQHVEQNDTEKQVTEESKTEEPIQNPEPPEVSAADIQPVETNTKTKKQETKKVKSEPRKPKSLSVREKVVKKVVKKNEDEAPIADDVKQTTQSNEESSQSEIKPINYAAAARANKPKKATTPPISEKPSTKIEKPEKKTPIKDKLKEKTPVQRKNSAK